jgi:hypothetical protein
MKDLIQRGKLVVENVQFVQKRKAEREKIQAAQGMETPVGDTSYKAFKDMLAEKEAKEKEKEARMIGPFIFDNDEDIDCEVLTSD